MPDADAGDELTPTGLRQDELTPTRGLGAPPPDSEAIQSCDLILDDLEPLAESDPDSPVTVESPWQRSIPPPLPRGDS